MPWAIAVIEDEQLGASRCACSATPACEGRGQAGGAPLPRRPRRGSAWPLVTTRRGRGGSKGQREPGRQRGLATAARRGVAGGRAGVAAAAVPAPAARSGVAAAATPASWGPRPRRDGRDRSVRGLRACAGMSRWLQAPVPPLARRMSPRRFPRFRVYNETGTDQTDPQSNGHHRKFARSNGLWLNGRRGTMVSPLLEAGLVYRDVLSLSRGTKGKKLSRIQV